jgi:hypothetical protein
VTPDKKGDWDVKADASTRGKELAKSSAFGQIKTRKKEGEIQTKHIWKKP